MGNPVTTSVAEQSQEASAAVRTRSCPLHLALALTIVLASAAIQADDRDVKLSSLILAKQRPPPPVSWGELGSSPSRGASL